MSLRAAVSIAPLASDDGRLDTEFHQVPIPRIWPQPSDTHEWWKVIGKDQRFHVLRSRKTRHAETILAAGTSTSHA
jgi:hypothetical protein